MKKIALFFWVSFCIGWSGACSYQARHLQGSLSLHDDDKAHFYPSQEKRPRADFVAEGADGMVASAHPLATKAGIDVLKRGGTAIDAAIAVSFMTGVVRPHSTGIGGGGFLLYYEKASGKVVAYDFRERAPDKASADMFLNKQGNPKDFDFGPIKIKEASVNGHLAVGIPGLVAGLVRVHKDHGSLPFKELLIPAISTAEDGFIVYPQLEEALQERKGVMERFPGTKKIFFSKGLPLKEGDVLKQKDLALTLREISEKGSEGFYKGFVAQLFIKEMKKYGLITQKDLDTYQVKMREPVEGTYKGYRIVSMPPPSSGGVHIIQILNILEDDSIQIYGRQSLKSLHLLVEAMRRAYADRAKYLGDPEFTKVPTKGLISKAYAKSLRQNIDDENPTPSKNLVQASPVAYESNTTTHFSIVDKWGNAVSSTQTINGSFGSGLVVPGTGVILNNEMDDFSIKPGAPNLFGLITDKANSIAPQKTMLSSMSPTMVFDRQGNLELVLGAPGGPKIITATLQTILNYITYDMPLEDAVHAYRVHHQFMPDVLYVEKNGLALEVLENLRSKGYKIEEKNEGIGDIQAIGRRNKMWVGVSDTRSTGKPMGY